MVHIHKKFQQYFFPEKAIYIKTLLIFASFAVVLVGIFMFTRDVYPQMSELAFIEHSIGNVGSVIPASCNSKPPDNHFPGDCPVGVGVNIGTGVNTVTANLLSTNVAGTTIDPDNPPAVTIALEGNNTTKYYSGVSPSGGGTYLTSTGANTWTVDGDSCTAPYVYIGYTSGGGATVCYYTGRSIPTSGWIVQLLPLAMGAVTSINPVRCTDGVHWTSIPMQTYTTFINNSDC